MSSETANIGLVLPELPEAFDLEGHWNRNSIIIDAEIGVLKQTTAEHTQDIEELKQTTTAQGQLIAGKQDQLTFDSTPTSGSSNPAISGGIAAAIADEAAARQSADAELHDAVGAVAALGAKNLLKVSSTTQTINGVTFTVNNDQTITVNGTNTGTSTALFVINDIPLQSGIAYTLSGCPSGGSSATYYIGSLDTTNWKEFTTDTGNGGTATLDEPKTIRFRIGIRSGVTVNNLVFKPMLRRAEITDDTFAPYAPTNRELYEMILALQSGATIQSAPASLMQAGRLDAELTDAQEVTDDA